MRLRDITLVSVSAGALITLVTGTALGLDRSVEAWIADASEEPVPVIVADEDLRPRPIRPGPAAVAGAPAVGEPASEEPIATGAVVPDLDGMRVGQARRLMRARGLRLVVRDDLSRPIAPEESASYRIRGEALDPPAGTAVEPGATVRARARDPRPVIFSGY